MSEPRKLLTPRGNVYVWTPAGYSGPNTVLYVHGYFDDVAKNFSAYHLADQFAASGVNAVFIVPEAPLGANDPVYFPDIDALLGYVREAGYTISTPVLVIGHSGAYRTIIKWLGSSAIGTIVLLDALYAGVSSFASWAKKPGHRLVSVVATATPIANSEKLKGVPNTTVLRATSTHMGLVNGTKGYISQYIQTFSNRSNTLLLVGLAALGYLVLRG